MRMNRTTAVIVALGGFGALYGCDSSPSGTDAGPPRVDAGPGMVDAGPGEVDSGPVTVDSGPVTVDAGPVTVDAGPADAGPPEPENFRVRLVNMIIGQPASTAAPLGAVRVCLNVNIGTTWAPTLIPSPIPYGGVSSYLPFTWGVGYTFRVYDAVTFGTASMCPAMADTTHLVEESVTAAEVELANYYSVIATGGTAAGCTGAGIPSAACPAVEVAVQMDDLTAPTAGMIRVSAVNGLVVPSATGPAPAIDVCLHPATGADITLAAGVPSRGVSDFLMMAEQAPTAATPSIITIKVANPTACSGAMIGAGAAGAVPTPDALNTRYMGTLPTTYDADDNYSLFVFPFGGGTGADPLFVPWANGVFDEADFVP